MPFLFTVDMYPTHYYPSIDSTNIKARELADNGAVSGTAVLAGYQTKGRGRLGKDWHSVAGKGLYCSVIIRPEIAIEDYPRITLVAGLAVAKTLDRYAGKICQLKWPNDVYFAGKKIAGILTESSALTNGNPKTRYAIVGIGININHGSEDFPFDLRKNVTSMLLETGSDTSVEDIFQAVRKELLRLLQVFAADGFQPLLKEWRKKDFLLGRTMLCVNTAGKKVEGLAMGVDDEGRLHVRDKEGYSHEVLSGDVRLASS